MVAEIPGFGDGHTFRKRDGRFGGQPFFEIFSNSDFENF